MTTLTATTVTATTVRLQVAAPDGARLESLTRTDTYGTRPVRLYEDADLVGGILVVTDGEPALMGTVRYQVTVRDVAGAREQAAASLALDVVPGTYVLAPASIPGQAVTLDMVTGYEATRATASVVHEVIGRADPLVSLGVQRTRAGQLTIWCADYTRALAAVAALGTGEILHLRQASYAGMDMYFTALSCTHSPAAVETVPPRWQVTCEYVETGVPTTPLLGSIGWTIAASTARNPTLAASSAEFATVLDLLIGPES